MMTMKKGVIEDESSAKEKQDIKAIENAKVSNTKTIKNLYVNELFVPENEKSRK